ncbi:hypothetical protein RJ639_043417, partial [Escallonia herrerae]
DESVKQTAQLMYQTALMESGFISSDPKEFATRIYDSVKSSLNVSPDAAIEEEEEAEEVEVESTTKEGDDSAKDEAEADTEAHDFKDEL